MEFEVCQVKRFCNCRFKIKLNSVEALLLHIWGKWKLKSLYNQLVFHYFPLDSMIPFRIMFIMVNPHSQQRLRYIVSPRQRWRNVICAVLSLALNGTLLFVSLVISRFASTSFVAGREIASPSSTDTNLSFECRPSEKVVIEWNCLNWNNDESENEMCFGAFACD